MCVWACVCVCICYLWVQVFADVSVQKGAFEQRVDGGAVPGADLKQLCQQQPELSAVALWYRCIAPPADLHYQLPQTAAFKLTHKHNLIHTCTHTHIHTTHRLVSTTLTGQSSTPDLKKVATVCGPFAYHPLGILRFCLRSEQFCDIDLQRF